MMEDNEDYQSPGPEERMEYFAELLRNSQNEMLNWKSQVPSLLQNFHDFLLNRPEPPAEWFARLGAQASKFDYHQIVLPNEITDPYLDEAENLVRLQDQLGNGTMAIENYLVTRNHFIFRDGILPPIELPRPTLMLESVPESKDVDWDCTITVYADGSWMGYNMDRDDEEIFGDSFSESIQKWMPLLSKMRILAPEEGVDFGLIGPISEELG